MAAAATKSTPETRPRTDPETDRPWLWNVVLIDDDAHSYEYVIAMMQVIFAMPLPRAFQIAKGVDTKGRAICLTTHKEHAELKRDQILSFGPDKLIAGCKGSMTAIIEPAEQGDDENDGNKGKNGDSGGGAKGE